MAVGSWFARDHRGVEPGRWGADDDADGRSVWVRRGIAMALAVVLVVLAAVVLVPAYRHGHHTTASATVATAASPGAASSDRHATTQPAGPTTSATAAGPSHTTNAITFSAVGDTELGKAGQLPPDPAAYLAPVVAALAAPIVFANLEGTLTDATTSKCDDDSTDCFAFRVPTTDAAVLRRAGFTVLNSANNHSHDFGSQGTGDTSAALAAAGIAQTGLPGQIAVVADGATKVAFVGFAPYADTNNMLDLATARTLIAHASTEAAVVVVYMHAGAEGEGAAHVTGQEETYVGEDRGNAKVFAHAAVDAGADVVIASGPHVLRGIEGYHGHLIDYSLGNFVNYHDFVAGGRTESAILHVTIGADGHLVGAAFTSVMLSATGQGSIDPTGAAAHLVNQLSAADFGPAAAVIGPDGRITLPAGG